MSSFKERERMSYQDAIKTLRKYSNMIAHLLLNDDGTFSIMYHIVCEWCDYCQLQGDCRLLENDDGSDITPLLAKSNPYSMHDCLLSLETKSLEELLNIYRSRDWTQYNIDPLVTVDDIKKIILQKQYISDNFLNDQKTWSNETFGSVNKRGPIGPIKHLKLEVEELLNEPFDLMEYADCLLLIIDASRRAGYSFEMLARAANEKLQINKMRHYPKPNGDEPSLHIKDVE